MSDEGEQLPPSTFTPPGLDVPEDWDHMQAQLDAIQRKIDKMKDDLAAIPIPSPS